MSLEFWLLADSMLVAIRRSLKGSGGFVGSFRRRPGIQTTLFDAPRGVEYSGQPSLSPMSCQSLRKSVY